VGCILSPLRGWSFGAAEEQQVPPLRSPFPSGRASSGRDDNAIEWDKIKWRDA